MKKLILALGLGVILVTPSFAFADIAPDPSWLPEETTSAEPVANEEPPIVVTDETDEAVGMYDDVTGEKLYDDNAGYIEGPSQSEIAWAAFAVVLYITIIVEVIAAAVTLALMRHSLHAVIAVPIASLITLPIFWSVAMAGAAGGAITEANWPFALIIGEVFIILVEAVILHVVHPTAITKRQALLVSAVMNVMSVLVGFAIGLS